MKRFTLLFTLLLVGGVITGAHIVAQDHMHHMNNQQIEQSQEQPKEVYTCPMHPEVTSNGPGYCPKCGMKLQKVGATEEKNDMKEAAPMETHKKTGVETFEKRIDGLHVEVWINTQEEHKKKMGDKMKDDTKHETMDKDMKHDMGGMEGMMHENKEQKNNMDAMMSGTHHIMVFVSDETNNKPIKDAVIEVVSTAPSKKNESTSLSAMKGHFGGGLNLDEKGNYFLLISLKVGDKTSKVPFVYNVQ